MRNGKILALASGKSIFQYSKLWLFVRILWSRETLSGTVIQIRLVTGAPKKHQTRKNMRHYPNPKIRTISLFLFFPKTSEHYIEQSVQCWKEMAKTFMHMQWLGFVLVCLKSVAKVNSCKIVKHIKHESILSVSGGKSEHQQSAQDTPPTW